jgi:hypothetical protein
LKQVAIRVQGIQQRVDPTLLADVCKPGAIAEGRDQSLLLDPALLLALPRDQRVGDFGEGRLNGLLILDESAASGGSLSLNGGSLFGTGTVNYGVVDTGIVSPGDSVVQTGKLGVSGTYKQNSGGVLDVTIGGITAGTKYDQLNVTKTATLGGALNISLASGYTPTVGNTFDILNASSISGNFSTINGLTINGSVGTLSQCPPAIHECRSRPSVPATTLGISRDHRRGCHR